jgi:hypothetical protein
LLSSCLDISANVDDFASVEKMIWQELKRQMSLDGSRSLQALIGKLKRMSHKLVYLGGCGRGNLIKESLTDIFSILKLLECLELFVLKNSTYNSLG